MTASGTDIVVIPGTGEVLDPRTLTAEQLVRVRAGLAELSSELAAAKTAVNLEITRRIDQENREGGSGYTWRIGGWKVTVPSPAAGGRLRDDALRDELIRQEPDIDVDRLFQRKTTFTLRMDRWRNLVKQRPELDEYRVFHTAPGPRTVTITQLPTLRSAIDATAEADDEA